MIYVINTDDSILGGPNNDDIEQVIQDIKMKILISKLKEILIIYRELTSIQGKMDQYTS